jgi:tRNA(Glu) U13 pseudouridine synthase TruD
MHFGAKRNHHHLIELNKIEYNSEVSFRTNNPQQDVQAENVFTEQAFIEEDPDSMWQEYKDHPQPVQLAQTIVYDLILKNVYKDKKSFLQWPKEKRCIAKTKYIL